MVKVYFCKGTHRVKSSTDNTIADQGHEWAEKCMCIFNTKSNVSKLTRSSYVKIMSRISYFLDWIKELKKPNNKPKPQTLV